MKANKAIYKKQRSAKRRIAKKYFYSVWLRFLDYILNWFDQWFIYLVLLTELLLFESIFFLLFFKLLNYFANAFIYFELCDSYEFFLKFL